MARPYLDIPERVRQKLVLSKFICFVRPNFSTQSRLPKEHYCGASRKSCQKTTGQSVAVRKFSSLFALLHPASVPKADCRKQIIVVPQGIAIKYNEKGAVRKFSLDLVSKFGSDCICSMVAKLSIMILSYRRQRALTPHLDRIHPPLEWTNSHLNMSSQHSCSASAFEVEDVPWAAGGCHVTLLH